MLLCYIEVDGKLKVVKLLDGDGALTDCIASKQMTNSVKS